jgi:hypothetical protein
MTVRLAWMNQQPLDLQRTFRLTPRFFGSSNSISTVSQLDRDNAAWANASERTPIATTSLRGGCVHHYADGVADWLR